MGKRKACPACQRENPADSAFCEGCGFELSRSCPRCGAEASGEARFCRRCGVPVVPAEVTARHKPSAPKPSAAGTPEAERRQLTVLFCDLVGSTRLAAEMDAEDWRELVRTYQESAAAVVERLDGHVAQYLGDGLLVYFGWPQAHEDDAERAVRAGLGIVDAIAERDERLAVRIGIHTGPVVVGEMGGGDARVRLATGNTTNVAARIQGEAEPDTVVMSAATLRLVSGIFVTQDLGEHALKGLPESVHLHRAERPSGVRSRLDVTAAAELTPFIGREQELMLLDDRFAQSAEGRGQAVLIQGEAGIGKSRLVQAFRERLAERPHSWLECRGSSYTQDSPFCPVLELQRQALALRPEHAAQTKLELLEAGLGRAGFDLAETVPVAAALLEVPLGGSYTPPNLAPEGLRRKTLALLSEWLLRLARRQPLVLLMEDLQWMDPSTLELLGGILEEAPMAPLLLVATYRPGFEPPWQARSDVTPMLLSRFTRSQTGTLLRRAARGGELPEAWVAEIVRRSDGVPLFAEELTKTALESRRGPSTGRELPELRIPETIQDALAARLDALGPVKELAQLGSVLGREFSYRLLREVSPLDEPELQRALEAAVREELLYHRGTPPEATYLFKHAMLRDAAYQSLLRTTRQRHHRRVAETLIERMPQVAAAHPELIAHHLSEAGQSERAIAYWQQAGQRAIARSANVEAIRQLDRGLAGVARLPEGPEQARRELELRTLLGVALISSEGYGSEAVERNFARARELCGRIGESPQLFRVLYGLWFFSIARAEGAQAVEAAERMFRFAEHSADRALRVHGHYVMGVTAFHRGEHRSAREHLESSLGLYDPVAHGSHALVYGRDPAVMSGSYLGTSLWYAGYPDQAVKRQELALSLARSLNHPYTLALALVLSSMLRMLCREPSEGESLASESLELAGEQGFRALLGPALYLRGWALAGADPEVIAALEQGETAYRDVGNRFYLSLMLAVTAKHYLQAGIPEKALGKLDDATCIAERDLELFHLPEVHRLKGEVLSEIAANEPAAIESSFRTALALAREQGARSLELRAATSLARLWQRQGRAAEARALLQPVYAWFTEGFGTQDLKDAKALLEELAR